MSIFEIRRGRPRAVVGVCAVAELAVVAAVAATQPTAGAASTVAALVLAPVAVAGVAVTAKRLGGVWSAAAASVVYVLLPFVANRFELPQARAAFDSRALPALLGLQTTDYFAAGVVAIWLIATLPERVAAALGAVVFVVALVVWSPGALGDVRPMLHETAWSVALPEWFVVATIVGALFKRPWLGVALGGFALAAILRASHQPLADAGFWRALAPLGPVAAVLTSSLWFLVPRLRSRPVRESLSAN